MQVEIVPPEPFEMVLSRLQALSSSASSVRAAVAFWTVSRSFIGSAFVKALAAPEGFLCVDIHLPTSIDYLAEMRRTGAHVCLHLFDLAGRTEDPGISALPPHLMHSKIMLFDEADGGATIWIGSHNGTQRALLGVNIETSVLIRTTQDSEVYAQAAASLARIRERCQLFDLKKIAYYKMLQQADGAVDVVEVETPTHEDLKGEAFSIFGVDMSDHRELKRVGKELVVAVTAADTHKERFYQARIAQTGEMKDGPNTTMAFGPRRFAFRAGRSLPILEPVGPIPSNVYSRSRYFATLELLELLPDDVVAYEPPPSKWVDDDSLPMAERFDRAMFTGKAGGKPPRVRRAREPDEVAPMQASLEMRRGLEDHALIRRRVLVRGGAG